MERRGRRGVPGAHRGLRFYLVWLPLVDPDSLFPRQTMFNLTHLSQVYTPIVTQSQFLARLSLPLSLERSDGQFVVGRDQALEDQIRERVSIFISPGAHYGTVPFTGDLPRILRVDRMPKAWSGRSTMSNEEAERAHQKLLTLRQKDGHGELRLAEPLFSRLLGELTCESSHVFSK